MRLPLKRQQPITDQKAGTLQLAPLMKGIRVRYQYLSNIRRAAQQVQVIPGNLYMDEVTVLPDKLRQGSNGVTSESQVQAYGK
jgi:hypothetical protein